MVKSLSAPGRRRWAMRIASSARSIAGATPSAVGIFTEITMVRATPVHRFERAQRQHHETVPRLSQHRALLRDHALHDQLDPANPDAPANGGFDVAEQLVGDVVAEHRDVAPLLDVDVADRRSRGDV